MSDQSENPKTPDSKQEKDTIEMIIADYLDQLNSGESIDPKEILAMYPGYGHEILESLQEFIDIGLPDEEPLDLASLGNYRIIRQIGEGSTGTVYEAEQVQYKRRVALKVLSQSTKRERFEREIEAISRLQHPNIVVLYEAGEQEGTQFIAQELVEGGFTLSDHLKALKNEGPLPPGYFREVANTLLHVAKALHYIHESNVIHRDVKPSNILLTKDGHPKVSDFGLAKLENALALTQSGESPGGTPFYMSPEQAESKRRKVDFRTDIYSLGVTLYEMLTLHRPFEGETSLAVLRQIISVDPKDPQKVNPKVPRDLATICLKAMEKDPDRRFQTMAEFAADLRRFHHGEVITARPAGPGLRLWKRFRRNPVVSTAMGIALLAVLFSLIGMPWMYWHAEKKQREAVDKEAVKTVEVLHFLSETLSSPVPGKDGREVKVVELLENSVDKIGKTYSYQPEVEATIRGSIGRMFQGLGQFDDALVQFQSALHIYDHLYVQGHPQTLSLQNDVAIILLEKGRYAEAEKTLREAMALSRRLHGDEDDNTLGLKSTLASAISYQGRADEAESIHRQVFESWRKKLGNHHPKTLTSMSNLALELIPLGHPSEAEEIYREILQVQEKSLDEDHPDLLITMENLANALCNQGKFAEAESLHRKVLDSRRRVLGDNHVAVYETTSNLAWVLEKQGNLAGAAPLYADALVFFQNEFGEDHPSTLSCSNGLAMVYLREGRFSDAAPLLKREMDIRKKQCPEGDAVMACTVGDYGFCLLRLKKFKDAEPPLLEALEHFKIHLGMKHQRTQFAIRHLKDLYDAMGRPEKAGEYQAMLSSTNNPGEEKPAPKKIN